MRLIDADELKEHLFVGEDYDKAINDGIGKTEKEVFAFKCGWNDALKSVAQYAPTVDPVKHGRWAKDMGGYWCTVCNEYYADVGYGYNYCPNCGAKMDEVEDV